MTYEEVFKIYGNKLLLGPGGKFGWLASREQQERLDADSYYFVPDGLSAPASGLYLKEALMLWNLNEITDAEYPGDNI